MTKHEILIIGGGASGVYLALQLKDYGHDVAIVESKDRILKKLLTTGNGRCNITNNHITGPVNKEFYSSHNQEYDYSPLMLYPHCVAEAYFESLGLPLVTLDDGKMYPRSLQAASVVDILRLSLAERNVPVYLNEKVKSIVKKDTFLIKTDSSEYQADKVVVSSGGSSLPSTGSDGSMFRVLKSLGLHIHSPLPVLVQLNLDHSHLKALSGVKFNANGFLKVDGQVVRTEFGEFLFTDYGISGPPVLQLSRFVSPLLRDGKRVTLSLDILPEAPPEAVKDYVLDHVSMFAYRTALDLFKGVIHSKLLPTLLKDAGIEKPSRIVETIEPSHFILLASLLKDWTFSITGTQGFSMAQGTYGGVDTRDLTDELESRDISGLYFTGEVIDVIGACGGYNLQWAWSSASAVLDSIEKQSKK